MLLSDLDGTLLLRWTPEEGGWKPRPAPWLGRLMAMGPIQAICTNQGGIAWNMAGGRPGRRYPAWPEVEARIRAGMALTGARWAFVALFHPGAPLPPPGSREWIARADAVGLPEAFRDPEAPWGEIEVPEGILRASWDPAWRKPNPGMLLAACAALGIRPEVDPVAYAGDEEDDRLAAQAAGMMFIPVPPPDRPRSCLAG